MCHKSTDCYATIHQYVIVTKPYAHLVIILNFHIAHLYCVIENPHPMPQSQQRKTSHLCEKLTNRKHAANA